MGKLEKYNYFQITTSQGFHTDYYVIALDYKEACKKSERIRDGFDVKKWRDCGGVFAITKLKRNDNLIFRVTIDSTVYSLASEEIDVIAGNINDAVNIAWQVALKTTDLNGKEKKTLFVVSAEELGEAIN